jgi:type I restriction enzyme, S subunit
MANRVVKIKDICHVVKGETGITKAIPGDYPMVTLAEERKTHNEYQFDCKAVIIPLVSSTGHGHASMKRIHFQHGKFALGSILCALVPKKENEYVPEYLYHILNMGKERIFVPLMKGMANVSLPMSRIKDVEINLPSFEDQLKLAEIYQEVAKDIDQLKTETEKQKDYISKLRQSILQMAVQGELTAKWREENPDVEPANVLLEKIKAKKEQLIKEGKIKRQKLLPPIVYEQKPFALPKSWEWVRLQNICSKIGSGSTPKGSNYAKDGVPFFRSQNIHNSGLVYDDIKYISKDIQHKMKGTIVRPDDILLNITGGSLGRCAHVPLSFSEGNVSQHVTIIRPMLLQNAFLHLQFLSPLLQKPIFDFSTGAGREGLPKYNLEKFTVSFPPLTEQKAIVSKVKQLMAWCDELEKKTEKRDDYLKKMMQAVVKQAVNA